MSKTIPFLSSGWTYLGLTTCPTGSKEKKATNQDIKVRDTKFKYANLSVQGIESRSFIGYQVQLCKSFKASPFHSPVLRDANSENGLFVVFVQHEVQYVYGMLILVTFCSCCLDQDVAKLVYGMLNLVPQIYWHTPVSEEIPQSEEARVIGGSNCVSLNSVAHFCSSAATDIVTRKNKKRV